MIWSTAAWRETGRVAPSPARVEEIGFNAAGTVAFVRQGMTRTIVRDAGTATPAMQPPVRAVRITAYEVTAGRAVPPVDIAVLPAGPEVFKTDYDRRRVMTSDGPLAFDATAPPRMSGSIDAYISDPHYGPVYAYDAHVAGVIGGFAAANKDFPWQVELRYWQPPTSHRGAAILHNCGGSLIRPG